MTADTGWQGSGLPLWLYTSFVDEGLSSQQSLDGQVLMELDGYTFGAGSLLGPTLVAEDVHQIYFQLQNNTTETVGLTAADVEVVDAPDIAVNDSQTTVLRTSTPTVSAYHAEGKQGLGLTGLVTVRDPAAFPVNDLDEHFNLILFEPDASAVMVNECAVQVGTSTGCPRMVAAEPGFTLLLAQRLIQAYTPEGVRHGGPPNEFLTQTFTAPTLSLTVGNDVRLNVYNMTSSSHTLSFGGLPFGDDGGPLPDLTLAPGEGRQFTAVALSGPGEHAVACVDCDLPMAQSGLVAIVDGAR